ncbi:MAG: 3-deoxy-manno-octulosonate cytidylyltransferase [bacterium]|nr:3-deoxy-manno-octulosonate cytidylyltransferase [bacterium]
MSANPTILIPARYKSSRYPGKPLADIAGTPLVIRVCKIAEQVLGKAAIAVATDDVRIQSVVEDAGYTAIMTPDTCLTGTDRLYHASLQLDSDIIINIQGDEPLVHPDDIRKIITAKLEHPNEVVCGMAKIGADEDPHSVNLPKVITNEKNELIYMSRLAIPGHKEANNKPNFYMKQVSIYGFNKSELKAFENMGRKSKIEHHEDIEILRFFELGIPIKMVEVFHKSHAVDVPGDVEVVCKLLQSNDT